MKKILKRVIKQISNRNSPENKAITLYFKLKDKSIKEVTAQVGDNILEIAHHNDIELEGACEA